MASKADIIRAAVFASGTGTNTENILRFARQHKDKLVISVIICNKEDAPVIAKAKAQGVSCEVIPVIRVAGESFSAARAAQEKKVLRILERHGVQWLLLAGYMQIMSPDFLKHFFDPTLGVNRVVNIHPSLLPQFPGKNGYGDAWNAGVKTAGVTLHFVDDGVDTGPIIAQKTFERHGDDTLDTFRARGLQLEYAVYQEFLTSLITEEKSWARRQG